jgi:tetratricopeptide (TPR) repeat protein
MKIKISTVLFLCCCTLNTLAQQHYQLMGSAVEEFLETLNDKYEEIPVVWNMEGTIQANLNDGINYVLENKPTLAEGSLNLVIKKNPTVWQAYYYRAIALKQQRKYHEALYDLQTVLRLNPKIYEAQVEVAKCYLAMNSFTESESAAKRAIQMNKKRAPAYYVKGCVYEIQRQGKAAINSFRDCLEADSLYHEARINIALVALLESKDEAIAIKEFTSVLALDSLQKNALLMRSILVFDRDKSQSLRDLNNLILVSPHNVMAYYLRGLLLTGMQRYDRGFSDFQTVIKSTATSENNFKGQQTWVDKKIDLQNVGAYTLTRVYGLNPEDATKLKQAYCLILTNAFDKSIAVLNSTSDQEGEPLVIYLKAVANEHQGRHAQALAFYDEAIRLDNTIADAYKKRAIYEQELKQWDKSIVDLTTVLRLLPESYVIYKIRGISYHYSGAFNKSIADYNSYLKHDSTDQQVIGYRGMAYKAINQRLKAYIDFGNSNNSQAFIIEDMLHLVDSVLQKGDTTLAVTALTSFVKSAPWFTEAYAMKLKLHLEQSDWPILELDLSRALRNSRADAAKEHRAFLFTLQGMVMRNANNEGALDAYDAAIRSDKSNAFAYLERGKFLLTKNKTAKAIDDLKKSASFGNLEARKLLEGLKR